MGTRAWIGTMGAALLATALLTSSPASAQGAPVSRQKSAELDSVAENQGNYDSPPATRPAAFARPGYDQCLVVLGSTYCRVKRGPWNELK